MELLAAVRTERDTIRFTVAHAGGAQTLEGSFAEIAAFAAAMREVSVLAAAAGEEEHCWLHELPVGDHLVRLGLRPGGEPRLLIAPL
jgi:hypothetical protein